MCVSVFITFFYLDFYIVYLQAQYSVCFNKKTKLDVGDIAVVVISMKATPMNAL